MIKYLFTSILFILLISNSLFSDENSTGYKDGDKIIGTWEILDGETHFEITRDENNLYQGKITWLKNPLNEDGKPKLDVENSDKKLRNRPLMGLSFLSNFKYMGDNKWEEGTLYGFKRGKSLEPKLSLVNENTMKVEAEIFFFTKTFEWKRVITK